MSRLVLGWKVNDNLDPKYWTNPAVRVGGQVNNEHLFHASAAHCASHTTIIAQSGSGKSSFLGRYVEELAVRTRARCVILDPNADFRRLAEVAGEDLWAEAGYDMLRRKGKLPHERTQQEFLDQWERVKVRVRGGVRSHEPSVTAVVVPWLSVSADFLAEGLGPVDRTGVRNCHDFVRTMHDLLTLRSLVAELELTDYLSRAERLLRQATTSPEDFSATVREEWGLRDLPRVTESAPRELVKRILHIDDLEADHVQSATEQRLSDALTAARSIGETARQFYFGKLSACRTTGVIDEKLALPKPAVGVPPQIDVLDLPSIDDSTRLLVVNAVLESEWESARGAWERALRSSPEEDDRVPLFVIVDEAHNLIPRDPRDRAEAAVRDQFRTFVAEGRKYGVFVVVVSQRPDKVDPIVLAECENRAVMRLSSKTTLALTREALGLEDVPSELLSACLSVPLGRALMVGPWSPAGPSFLYAAARRTIEGGRNLREEHWAAQP